MTTFRLSASPPHVHKLYFYPPISLQSAFHLLISCIYHHNTACIAYFLPRHAFYSLPINCSPRLWIPGLVDIVLTVLSIAISSVAHVIITQRARTFIRRFPHASHVLPQ
jgi:hypothetical protein